MVMVVGVRLSLLRRFKAEQISILYPYISHNFFLTNINLIFQNNYMSMLDIFQYNFSSFATVLLKA